MIHMYFLQSVILKAFTKLCETGKRNNILNQLFCLTAYVCCFVWGSNKSVFSSPLLSLYLCTSMRTLLKSGDFQRSTECSPYLGSKTPFCSLWRTVGTDAQKQLWRGFRVILCGEILIIDCISRAKSFRSCPVNDCSGFSALLLPPSLSSWSFV